MSVIGGDDYTRVNYRYRIKKCTFMNNNDSIDLEPMQIRSIELLNDYEKNYYPIMKINMSMSNDLYYTILKNKNTCTLFLRITKFRMYPDKKDSEKSVESNFINGNFNLILSEGTDDMAAQMKRDSASYDFKKISKETNEVSISNDKPVSFYIYSNDTLSSRNTVNVVYNEASIADTITAILQTNKIKKAHFVKPDNTSIYKQIFVPPLPFIKSLSFIDTYYGIYKKGSTIFNDLNKLFIIPYNGVSEKVSDITNIVVPNGKISSSIASSSGMMTVKNKKDQYIIADAASLEINNASITNNYISGNDVIVIDGSDSSVKGSSSAVNKTSANANVVENKTMNKYLHSMYTTQTSAASYIINLRLADYDMDVIDLSHAIKLVFEDTAIMNKYKGKYIISNVTSVLSTEGYDEMTLDSSVTFKKV